MVAERPVIKQGLPVLFPSPLTAVYEGGQSRNTREPNFLFWTLFSGVLDCLWDGGDTSFPPLAILWKAPGSSESYWGQTCSWCSKQWPTHDQKQWFPASLTQLGQLYLFHFLHNSNYQSSGQNNSGHCQDIEINEMKILREGKTKTMVKPRSSNLTNVYIRTRLYGFSVTCVCVRGYMQNLLTCLCSVHWRWLPF